MEYFLYWKRSVAFRYTPLFFNTKITFYQNKNPHYKYKMISQLSYHYENPYTWKDGLCIEMRPGTEH